MKNFNKKLILFLFKSTDTIVFINLIFILIMLILALLWCIYPTVNFEPFIVLFGFILAILTGIPPILNILYPQYKIKFKVDPDMYELSKLNNLEDKEYLVKVDRSSLAFVSAEKPILLLKVINASEDLLPIVVNQISIELGSKGSLPIVSNDETQKITAFMCHSDKAEWVLFPSQEATFYMSGSMLKYINDCGIKDIRILNNSNLNYSCSKDIIIKTENLFPKLIKYN
ncbi:MAG: hypothetical protein KA536_10370 [Saprospiraceae bacterium]|nr:hypothetical protein [Saprospiraceae bacterium]